MGQSTIVPGILTKTMKHNETFSVSFLTLFTNWESQMLRDQRSVVGIFLLPRLDTLPNTVLLPLEPWSNTA